MRKQPMIAQRQSQACDGVENQKGNDRRTRVKVEREYASGNRRDDVDYGKWNIQPRLVQLNL